MDPENFDRENYIFIRHFETCYEIIRTQITTYYTSTLKSLCESLIQKHMDIWWRCFRLNGQYRFKMADIIYTYICFPVRII